MIDLDVRIDSSLQEDDYRYLADIAKVPLPEDFPHGYVLSYDKASKEDYINARRLALMYLQSEEAIKYAVKSVITRLYKANYVYIELSFAPWLYSRNNYRQHQLISFVVDTVNEEMEKHPGLVVNIVLYCHRDAPIAYNRETVKFARLFMNGRVVGVGLEGDDNGKKISSYKALFEPARNAGLPIAIELGNNYNSHLSILHALDIGAKRIIAPYKIERDLKTAQELNKRHAYLEFRPSLDIIYGYNDKIENIKLRDYLYAGLPVFISGSAYYIADASMERECTHLIHSDDFKRHEIQQLLLNALSGAFEKDLRVKAKVIKEYTKLFDDFYFKVY